MAKRDFTRARYRYVVNGQAFIIYRAGNAYSRWLVFADNGNRYSPVLARAASEYAAQMHAVILANQGKGAVAA